MAQKQSAPSSGATVLETILDWSLGRPVWQGDALRRIISKGKLDAVDIKELVELCKQGRGRQGNTTPQPLEKCHLPASPGQATAISLVSISNVVGVNNLAHDQILHFEPNGLTVIYGDNGAGKSGYARILKRACRARHAGEIAANIYASQPPSGLASAKIAYSIGGIPQSPVQWVNSATPHSVLSAVSVFDSDCASVHINKKNEVAFRPFGLDIPDELANACQAVRDSLAAEQLQQEQSRNPIFSRPSWKESTAVGRTIAGLKHDTDLEKIKDLSTLTDEETARLARLKEDLSKNPAKAAAEQLLKADNLKRLLSCLEVVAEKTSDETLLVTRALASTAKFKRDVARLAGAGAFSKDPLEGIGGSVWRSLWEAARRYSTEIAYPGSPFPPNTAEMLCLLCQQPLQPEAFDRMGRFERFIKDDSEKQAQAAERDLEIGIEAITSLEISTLSQKANLQELQLQSEDIARRARRFFATCRLRRYVLMRSLNADEQFALRPIQNDPRADIAKVESTIRAYAAELQRTSAVDERKRLEIDLAELSDRFLLGAIIQTVQEEIERLKTIRFLEQCAADTVTTAITKLGNDIADTVITPKLKDRFQEEIVKLAADKVRVEMLRSGGKHGSPQYQVRILARPNAMVGEVLSEGEQTCVALASFLTELATAMHQSTLVFDDPVTSLDHKWRKQVAKRLVEEAQHRQIIVFTHDLIFVTDLEDLAAQEKRPTKLITVSRGQAGAGMVSEGLPWKGKSVEDRLDKLEKKAREAKRLYDNDEDDRYNEQAGDIYSDLRSSWERALEEIVFFRVVQRHRDFIDTKNLRKVTVLDDTDCDTFHAGFKRCCDITDAHDKSMGRNAPAPPPNDMAQDILILRAWVQTLRLRQKDIK